MVTGLYSSRIANAGEAVVFRREKQICSESCVHFFFFFGGEGRRGWNRQIYEPVEHILFEVDKQAEDSMTTYEVIKVSSPVCLGSYDQYVRGEQYLNHKCRCWPVHLIQNDTLSVESVQYLQNNVISLLLIWCTCVIARHGATKLILVNFVSACR